MIRAEASAYQTKTSPWSRIRRVAGRVLIYAVLVTLSAIFIIPFIWQLSSSLKEQGQVFAYPPQWIPNPWMWVNYADATQRAPLWLWLQNTAVITFLSTVGGVITASMVGFGFARLRFPGRSILFVVLLATMMLPGHVTLIPRFIMFKEFGWNDTWFPLIVPSWFGGGPAAIFLVRQYYLTLPRDLDEAAKIDGCSNWGVWWRILVPLSYPVLVAITIFAFLDHWNEFLNALIFLQSDSIKTLSIGLRRFINPYDASWHITMAASMWLTIPVILIFFIGQRYFIKGIAMSGITGR
jgi:multiple sugar transport system permease protein